MAFPFEARSLSVAVFIIFFYFILPPLVVSASFSKYMYVSASVYTEKPWHCVESVRPTLHQPSTVSVFFLSRYIVDKTNGNRAEESAIARITDEIIIIIMFLRRCSKIVKDDEATLIH